jgi:exonuclease SbcC
LVRLNQDEMAVELIFALEGQTYRVLRQRKVGKRSRTLLDFQMRDEGRWRSLSEGGVRPTQHKIEGVLRLDYDTFVNSAFLRQGRADEFTVKTAAERKRVLGDILGLDRWSTYEERVKERQKGVDAEAEAIAVRLDEIEAELSRRTEYEAQLAAAEAAVEELSGALEEAQRAYQRVETARAELRHREAQLGDQDEQVERAEQELSRVASERLEHEERLGGYEQLLGQREVIEAGYRAYQEAVDQERRLGQRLRQSVELDEQRRELESRISQARHQLEAEREVVVRRLKELEDRLPSSALLGELDEAQGQLEHLTRLAESREAARDDLASIAEEQAALRARNEGLRIEMEALRERMGQLNQAGAECPLCEQPLTEQHRLELLNQIGSGGRALGDTYRANQTQVENLGRRASALQGQIQETDRELRDLTPLQRRVAALTERVEQGHQAAQDLEKAREVLTTLEHELAGEDYAEGVRASLKDVLTQAEALGYDARAHEEARDAVAKGLVFAEQKAQLQTVQDRIAEEKAALERLAEAEQRWRGELAAVRDRRAMVENQAAALREELVHADAVEQELHRMRALEAEARQRLGAAQQRLLACEALEQQRADKLERKRTLEREQGIYGDLRTAFGIRGVPAMIIEAAVPEIETEANRLLSRMTNGRMTVRFDTQRETKAGQVREALEIQIADELGTRPYENYSGGEQFRVNFAIRIALSKLLARRAGAQLQTLVVDEGFGTQDATGRQRLVEAINAVQEDFARVLVITHISELKDAFPVRIEVTKLAQGSVVDVV